MKGYEQVMAEIELKNRHAEQFKLLRRAVSNKRFFLREKAKTAPIREREKIDFALKALDDILDQVKQHYIERR